MPPGQAAASALPAPAADGGDGDGVAIGLGVALATALCGWAATAYFLTSRRPKQGLAQPLIETA